MNIEDRVCPKCDGRIHLLNTTNELKYYCPSCDKRLTEQELKHV